MKKQRSGSSDSIQKRKYTVAMYIALLVSIMFIALGFVMPDIINHYIDANLLSTAQIRESAVYNLSFSTEIPVTRLDTLEKFSLLDPDSGRFMVTGYKLDQNTVKQIIYSLLNDSVFRDTPDMLPHTSLYNLLIVAVPETYKARDVDPEVYNESKEQQERIFWRCFWKDDAGRLQYAWIDDQTGCLAGFQLDLSYMDYFRNDAESLHNKEEACVNILREYFKKYYNSFVMVSDVLFSVQTDGTYVDSWLLDFKPAQHDDIMSDILPLRFELCFSNEKLYFNTPKTNNG